MAESSGYSRPAVAGSGAIACGVAAAATVAAEQVLLLARSEGSANRAEETTAAGCEKLERGDRSRLRITTDAAELAECDLVIESVIEDLAVKGKVLSEVGSAAPAADLATTTSSLSVARIAELSDHQDRVFGLHPFNPVARMELVEVCFPEPIRDGLRERALAWCEHLGKSPVEVPDQAGFVVNRLLFPYLFDAVRLLERTGMRPQEVDSCMTLGAGHPMGPLALLDFVGLDVAVAIGEALYAESGDPAHRGPEMLVGLVGEGKLGRKSGAGFHDYD